MMPEQNQAPYGPKSQKQCSIGHRDRASNPPRIRFDPVRDPRSANSRGLRQVGKGGKSLSGVTGQLFTEM